MSWRKCLRCLTPWGTKCSCASSWPIGFSDPTFFDGNYIANDHMTHMTSPALPIFRPHLCSLCRPTMLRPRVAAPANHQLTKVENSSTEKLGAKKMLKEAIENWESAAKMGQETSRHYINIKTINTAIICTYCWLLLYEALRQWNYPAAMVTNGHTRSRWSKNLVSRDVKNHQVGHNITISHLIWGFP